jgi:hypothetical protein
MRNAYNILVREKGRDHSEDEGVNGKIILERILGKEGVRLQSGCIWLRTGRGGRPL